MTGYTLTIGYMGGYSCKLSNEEAWQCLVKSTQELREQPQRLIEEARRLNAPETCDQGCCTLEGVAGTYSASFTGGNPLVINHEKGYVAQYASGSDRAIKEHMRRAFCRIVIEEMHRVGIEVCLSVA